jgi:hypothetical protein
MATKRIITISAVSAVVIIGAGFLIAQLTGPVYVPQNFFEQRVAGADASKNIARLVEDSLANLQKIETADKASDTSTALQLVTFERSNKQEKQNAAIALASSLEQMARYTETITPERARRLSVEAVTVGVSMVSHLIIYNSNLESLFEALNIKFSGQGYTGPNVADLVQSINQESKQINVLSEKFNALLENFDSKYVD